MRRVAIATILGLWAACGPAAAQTKTGTTIGHFAGIEPSARFAAMGNAGVAVDGGIQSVYYNPAALGNIADLTVQLSHGFWFADIQYDYAAAALPLGNWGNVFLSVTALNSGDIAVRTVEQPLGTGENYTVRDLGISLGYARLLTDRVSAGVQVHYLNETIWHSSLDVVTASLGTSYRLTEGGLTLGSSLQHFGTKGRFGGRDLAVQFDRDPTQYGDNSALPANQLTDEFPVPILFRVGLSYPRRLSETTQILVAVDAFHPSDNTEGMSLGWEWTWRDALAVRAGYQKLGQRDSDLGPTAGVGVRGALGARRFHLDYAWGSHLYLAETHRITFVLGL